MLMSQNKKKKGKNLRNSPNPTIKIKKITNQNESWNYGRDAKG